MLSINISELIWTIINFFLLLFVLKYLLFRPIVRFMDERQARIDAGLEAERSAKAALDEQALNFEERKHTALEEARALVDHAGKAAEAERAQLIADAKVRSADARQQAEGELRRRSEEELAALDGREDELAGELARQLLRGED